MLVEKNIEVNEPCTNNTCILGLSLQFGIMIVQYKTGVQSITKSSLVSNVPQTVDSVEHTGIFTQHKP
jgi:hypothetical protein